MSLETLPRAPFAEGEPLCPDPKQLERLLSTALSRGGEHADLFFEYRLGARYVLGQGRIETAGRGVSLGLGVRVVHGEATGLAHTEDLSEEAMLRAARTAAQIASSGGGAFRIDWHPLSLPEGRYTGERAAARAPGRAKVALLERAEVAARAADRRVVQVQASLVESLREVLLASSDGVLVRDVQPMVRFGIQVIVEERAGGQRQQGGSGGGGRTGLDYFETHAPEEHAREAVRHALAMLDAREAPAGELPVVLAPGDSGILLHEAIGHGLEADFNRKGTSRYAGRIGETVASELCTVVDDATYAASRGSLAVDDEGVVPGRTVLIERGKLVGYMQDRQSARVMGSNPTGNGRRESFRHVPMPRMTNTVLLAGEDDPEEILRGVSRGVFARKFGGGQVDISNGDFVFSLTEAYLIEEGRLTAPLRGVNLVGNGPQVLGRVDALGHDLALSDGIWTCGKEGQSVPVGVGCPTVRIREMTVGGTHI